MPRVTVCVVGGAGVAFRRLSASYSLKIEVLEIDLPNRCEPFHFRAGSDMRVMRDITRPKGLRERQLRGSKFRAGNVADGSSAPFQSLDEQTYGRPMMPARHRKAMNDSFGEIVTALGHRATPAVVGGFNWSMQHT